MIAVPTAWCSVALALLVALHEGEPSGLACFSSDPRHHVPDLFNGVSPPFGAEMAPKLFGGIQELEPSCRRALQVQRCSCTGQRLALPTRTAGAFPG